MEKKINKAYHWKEQNTIKILGLPLFQWKNEIYENPDSNEGKLDIIEKMMLGDSKDASNSK